MSFYYNNVPHLQKKEVLTLEEWPGELWKWMGELGRKLGNISLYCPFPLCQARGPNSHVLSHLSASCPLKGDKAAALTLDQEGEISSHHTVPSRKLPSPLACPAIKVPSELGSAGSRPMGGAGDAGVSFCSLYILVACNHPPVIFSSPTFSF